MSDDLATLASQFLTRDGDGRYAYTEDNERHLSTIVEASALVDEAGLLRAKVVHLLGLARVLREQQAAPAAAAAIERAVLASPTAVAVLGLGRPEDADLDQTARDFEALSDRAVTVRRAPTLDAPAPEGTFKPPRPLKG
jgi:hypothetical protein